VSNNFSAHIQGKNVKILASKISLGIVEGGKGLRLAFYFIIRSRLYLAGIWPLLLYPYPEHTLNCNQKKNEYPYKNFPHHIPSLFY